MLCQFSFRNYRSYRDEAELSMQATPMREFERSLIECPDGQSFLPVAAVYGPNAGGKSNLLEALDYVRSAVARPIRLLSASSDAPEGNRPSIPRCSAFEFDDVSALEPTEFELYYRAGEHEYRYALSVHADEIERTYGPLTCKALPALMEWLALRSDLDSLAGETHAITMMTIHSAKGLEFPAVFVAGMEEGIFPHVHDFGGSDDPGKLEEERRLAYVAITRAKKALTILYTKSRVIYGRTEFCTPSRFLDEIPDDLLERETARPRPVVTNRRPAPDTARRSSTFGSAPERSTLSIAVGSRVLHPVFGEGVVVASQDMGNDTLLEVEFFSGQTKKLMQNYAKLKLK